MEIYLLAAMIVVYAITAWVVNAPRLKKIWLSAFMVTFLITGIALSFVHFSGQEIMMNATELSWYYILYLFASIMTVLGLINLWLFRHSLWDILFADQEDD